MGHLENSAINLNFHFQGIKNKIYSRLLRCNSARGSGSGLSLGGPTKAKACKSFLFTEFSLKVENNKHLIDLVVTLYVIKL